LFLGSNHWNEPNRWMLKNDKAFEIYSWKFDAIVKLQWIPFNCYHHFLILNRIPKSLEVLLQTKQQLLVICSQIEPRFIEHHNELQLWCLLEQISWNKWFLRKTRLAFRVFISLLEPIENASQQAQTFVLSDDESYFVEFRWTSLTPWLKRMVIVEVLPDFRPSF
jgi:hypothetical protein